MGFYDALVFCHLDKNNNDEEKTLEIYLKGLQLYQ